MSTSRRVALVGVIGLLVAAFLVVRLLGEFEWNPSTTIKFGAEFPEQVEYATALLGDPIVAQDAGHDGKFYFSQAMDPFYLEPAVHARYLDRPTYRAQRMFYPMVASLGGLLQPTSAAWGLIVVNILAMGLGTAVTARLAVELGVSAWWGLAFPFNPGMIVSLYVDSADIIALAALMAAVFFAIRDRPLATAGLLTIAALGRETMVLAAIGLIVYWRREKARIPRVLYLPFGVVAVWWAYVHWRLSDGLGQDTEAIGWPLQGFVEAVRGWLTTPNSLPDALIGFALLIASISIAIRTLRQPSTLGWAVWGFAPLAVVLSEPVWAEYFDSSRALAPVFTAFILLVAANAVVYRAPSPVEASHLGSDHG